MNAAGARPAPGTVVRLLRLAGFPILQQLQLEEALLRATHHNWFVLNDGTPQPAIVLGVSGKPRQLVHLAAAAAHGVALIRRFTGGGTVVVDRDTLFTSLIMQHQSLPGVEPYPRPVMRVSCPAVGGLVHWRTCRASLCEPAHQVWLHVGVPNRCSLSSHDS